MFQKEQELDEDEVYLKRLEGGLFTLQLIDYIMLEICASGPPSIKQRVTLILNQRGASLKTIRHIMRGELFGCLGLLLHSLFCLWLQATFLIIVPRNFDGRLHGPPECWTGLATTLEMDSDIEY